MYIRYIRGDLEKSFPLRKPEPAIRLLFHFGRKNDELDLNI